MNDDALIQLAQRMGDDPAYIAWLIRLVLDARQQKWEELAASLQLTPKQLAMLALCRRPTAKYFIRDIEQIAEYIPMNKFELISFVREAETLESFQHPGSSNMVARDHDGNSE